MFALLEDPPLAADEYLEAATKDTERLIRSVMHVRWRLIAGIMIQIPSTNHEVIHSANVAPSVFGNALGGYVLVIAVAPGVGSVLVRARGGVAMIGLGVTVAVTGQAQ